MNICDALGAVRTAPTLLEAMRAAPALVEAARRDAGGARAVRPLTDAVRAGAGPAGDGRVVDAQPGDDHITAIAAVHALAGVRSAAAADALTSVLLQGPPFLREHAAWAFGARGVHPPAVPALAALAAGGGFPGMLAERTLDAWGPLPEPGPAPGADGGRAAAPSSSAVGSSAVTRGPDRAGLTVAQVFLHADIDRDLTHAGQGDNGGIATLLVRLGDALVADGRVARVLTISRGTPTDAPGTWQGLRAPGHHFPSVPFAGPVVHAPDAWSRWAQARDGIRRILDAAGPVDVLHLRMADVGSMVAADVASERGIPVVFTAAPDPHTLIAARDAAGTLTRATFGPADVAEHLWFRHDLAAALAGQAAHVVLFPRPDVARDARDLLGFDLAARPERFSVVPEGIDLTVIDRAHAEVSTAPGRGTTGRALGDLDALLATLPPKRRGLPLAVTVGRLHRVKGMATLVQAWAAHPGLRARCNLLVVGGDLEDPSDDEQEQLARIDSALPRADGPARGLLLAGHRANGTVAVWLAAARAGRPGLAAPAGVYVCASLKEEFGIAILEAMACGLVVVAPAAGGPPTYVEDGVTGVLVDTADVAALARAVAAALDLAAAPGAGRRAEHAHAMVRERFGIEAMATALAAVYAGVAASAADGTRPERAPDADSDAEATYSRSDTDTDGATDTDFDGATDTDFDGATSSDSATRAAEDQEGPPS